MPYFKTVICVCAVCVGAVTQVWSYISLQQVVHAARCCLAGLLKLLHCLADLLIRDLPLALLLVVIVQAPALHLLQVMLPGYEGGAGPLSACQAAIFTPCQFWKGPFLGKLKLYLHLFFFFAIFSFT